MFERMCTAVNHRKKMTVRFNMSLDTLTTTSVVREARPRTKCSRALKVPTPSALGRRGEVEGKRWRRRVKRK